MDKTSSGRPIPAPLRHSEHRCLIDQRELPAPSRGSPRHDRGKVSISSERNPAKPNSTDGFQGIYGDRC